jgi:VanZ family protein
MGQPISHKKYWLAAALGWWAITLWLLTLPGSKIPHEDWYDLVQVDKWVHFAFFFAFVWLFFKALTRYKWLVITTFTAIAYGIAIEFVQKYCVINRSFDVWDIAADTVGAVTAFVYCKKQAVRY